MRRVVLVIGVLVVALAGAIVIRGVTNDSEDPLVVVHWSNSHPMRDGLLPAMVEEFNAADHETSDGRPIEVELVPCDSSNQALDLAARVKRAGRAEEGCEGDDPTIVTPQSTDWIVDVNRDTGRDVVDLGSTESIAKTWIGIVTYREMAECLGWPDREIGYADILALRADPDGWKAYSDCARTEWGRRPLLAFTNPRTSTTGRNVLVSLYATAAGKSPRELTVDDVERPDVVQYVKDFQQLVDHYLPGTIPLNTKIVQGPRYGHFFLMPEDNLVSLYKGNETAIGPRGTKKPVRPVKDLVMMYPSEGSVLNSNPAGVVSATWVDDDDTDAAREWVEFLREDEQQSTFMAAGFRPATELTVDDRRFARWGLDATKPTATIEPGDLAPDALERIVDSWGSVKKPAIVTFVADVSGSMTGEPLRELKKGLNAVLDGMRETENQVGLVTFSDEIVTEIAPAPLDKNRFDLADAIDQMETLGQTGLYDAVKRAIELSDEVPGDPGATRAIVVLSDGAANTGDVCLHDIVTVRSRSEAPVPDFCGFQGDEARDTNGRSVPKHQLVGGSLRMDHEHDVQVFFIGFGAADIDVGRVLAQATGAEYQGSTQEDLAAVIEAFGEHF